MTGGKAKNSRQRATPGTPVEQETDGKEKLLHLRGLAVGDTD